MRKSKTVVVEGDPAKNRDAGRTYVIREMPSRQAEAWGLRMMEALAKSGVYIPPDVGAAGLAGVAILGMNAVMGAPFALTGPLLDEMFEACVSFVPEPSKPMVYRGANMVNSTPSLGPLIDDDIEEVKTRLMLRSEVFELHTGFSPAAFLSQQWSTLKAALNSLNTETSGASAEPSSRPASPPSMN